MKFTQDKRLRNKNAISNHPRVFHNLEKNGSRQLAAYETPLSYLCISIKNLPSTIFSRSVLTNRLQKFSISFLVAVTLVAS